MQGRLLIPLALCALVSGCAGPSVWERSFQAEPGVTITRDHAADATPVVRDAPWERVIDALAAERRAVAQSDTHRSEWTESETLAVESDLLAALQLPRGIEGRLIGRSNFKTTSPLDPGGGDLAAFAASIGADYAVWSRIFLGKAETVEREPVFVEGYRTERVWDADRNRYVHDRRWRTDTVWVPIVVERDEVRWVVFYVDVR